MLTRILCGFFLCVASLRAESAVWKITRGPSTLYLGGTCHVLRETDFPLPTEFDLAYAASSQLIFETDIAKIQSGGMQDVVMRHGAFTDGGSLQDVLTPEAWSAVLRYAEDAGLPIEQVQLFKPWMFVLVVTSTELQKLGVNSQGVDSHYHAKATADGKKIGELETFDQQVQFLLRLGAGHESELIANTLQELSQLPQQLEGMLTAWRAGDVEAIDRLMLHDIRSRYPEVYADLFVARNTAWIRKIEAFLRTPDVELVLVGAGHLAGTEGLLELLRTRGYRIEQLAAPANAHSEPLVPPANPKSE